MSHGAITLFRRQYLAILRRCAAVNAMGWMACGLAGGLAALPGQGEAAGPGIVTDGRTQTTVSPVGPSGSPGAVLDITTRTVQGVNAFNSFSHFNVAPAQTVNLHLPTGTANLLNMVHLSASQVDGVVNAYKDGRIGGNVFFLNPHGFVLGAGGQMNVGSVLVATPTAGFLNDLLDGQGRIGQGALAATLRGDIPITSSGLISIKGRIRAAEGAMLSAGSVDVAAGGLIQVGAGARVALGQLVNLQGLQEGGVSHVSGDSVRIVAAGDVDVAGEVSVDGTGADGNGGRIDVWADGVARFHSGGVLSARGADAGGDGGFIEFSARETVQLAGGRFQVGARAGRAGSVLIDPNDIEVVGNSVFTDGGNYTLLANDRITVGPNVVLSTRNVANPQSADHETAASEGDSGNLTLQASHIDIQQGAKLLAHADNGHAAGDVTLLARDVNALGADRSADASVTLDRATVRGGNILIRAEADTSALAVLLAQSPGTTVAQAQGFIDKELDSLSDGPGGEFLAVKTKAVAKTTLRGSRVEGSGDVTVQALAAARAGFDKDAIAEMLITDAPAAGPLPAAATVIRGRNVKIEAQASTSFTLNVLGSLTKLADRSWLPSDDATLTALNDQLFDFSSVPLVSLSKAKGVVRIDGDSEVSATQALEIRSEAISAAKPTFSGLLVLSAAWGESTAEASTQVQGNTRLNAGGAAKVQASTDVEVNVTATVNSTNKPIDAVFVYADNEATTTAETGAGTRIRAASVALSATNTSDLSVSGTAANTGGSGLGIAVAVNQSVNTVTAKLGGDVASSSGDVEVKASIDMAKNTTSADASTLGNPNTLSAKMTNFTAGIQRNVTSGILGATGKMSSATADKVSGFLFPGIKEGKLNLSGAVSYNDSNNTARASVADGARVQSAQDLSVTAEVKDRPTSTVGAKTTSTGTAIGGAVALANFQNHAQAWIGKGAVVDAKRATRVDAQTRIPYAWQIDWNSPDAILNHLQGNVLDLVFTSFGINSASGKSGAGLAAAVTVFDMDNSARAWVDEGARVNTVFTAGTPGTPGVMQQSVTVFAKNDVNMVHAVGIVGKKVLGTSGGKAAIGGSANVLDLDTTASALILGAADVRATQGVTVAAEQATQVVSVAEAGGQSDSVGVEGAVAVNLIKQTTLAGVDDDARVQAGGPVSVQALGDLEDISVAGGVVATKGQVGIGFAVVVNQVDTDTKAVIGNVDATGRDAAGVQGALSSGGKLDVKATSDTEVGAYAVAGAIATSSKAQTDAPAAGDSSTQSGSSGAGTGKFGIAVSADASWNEVVADTTAAITDGAQVNQATDVNVVAANTLAINALAGAVTISTQANGNGLAGSLAYNQLGGQTQAFIQDARVRNSGATTVDAQVTGEINSLAASVQGSRGKLGVAGSVAINEIAHWTQAFVSGSDLAGSSSLSLSARDESAIRSLAGALGVGGKAGIGLSFGWNHIDNRVKAALTGSDVNTSGAVTVAATSDASIETVAASLGASTGQMAGAAAVAINQIDTQTEARVEGRKTAAGLDAASLSVSATDTSGIEAIVGALGLSAGKAAFGVSFAWNQIGSGVKASLLNATVDTSGLSSVSALHDADIEAYAMGGGGAAKVGVSGSLAINDIDTQVAARSEGSAVNAGGVALSATQRGGIFAVTGALSGGGTAAVGASGSYNHIGGSVLAEAQGGSLNARSGSVSVAAQREGEVEVWAASGSGGGTAGFAGSIAINELGGATTARVGQGAQVTAEHNVAVTADTSQSVEARAGTVALGGTVGGGGAIAVNDLSGQTTAEVADAGTAVNAKAQGAGTLSVDGARVKGTVVAATSSSTVDSILANVAGGGKVGVAATVSVNLLGGGTTAQVRDGASVQVDANGASTAQQARVFAQHDDTVNAGAGGLAIGGVAGVGGAVDTTVLSHETLAQVKDASVAARASVGVNARHTVETQQVVVGASGGGVASANLSGTVLLAKMRTQSLADGATLRSQNGNVSVQADSSLVATHLVGGLDISGAAGFGASVVVTVAEQQTRAATLGNTVIDANGVTTVKATSAQDVEVKAATGSGSGGVGIAGTVAVTVLKGQTDASVGGASRVNQNTAAGLTGQDVVVEAADTTSVDNLLGALGVGLSAGGVGATADVTLVKSGVSATVGQGAQLRAGRDIKVDAQATRDLKSLTVAASGGLTFGVSGAVSYIGVGGRADSGAQSELLGSVNEASAIGSRDALGSQASADGRDTSGSKQRTNSARSGVNLTQDFNTVPTATSAAATVAAGASLSAGRDVSVDAGTRTDVQATAAGVAVSGGLSLGGGVAIAKVDDRTLARVAGQVTANRNVAITAHDDQGASSHLKAYAGGGGLVGLGASVALMDKTSQVTAEVAPDAVVSATGTAAADATAGTGQVRVDALSRHDLKSEAVGAAVGLGGVGAAIAHASENGVTAASVGERARITAKGLDVHGHSETRTVAEATAAAGGIVSGAGADAQALDRHQAQASLGADAQVTTLGGLTQVRADVAPKASAETFGVAVSAGVSIGVALSKAEVATQALASVGARSNVQAGGFALNAATLAHPAGGTQARSKAAAASGGLLLGAGATEADAIVTSRTQASLGQGVVIGSSGALDVSATSVTSGDSAATGVYFGALAGGSNRATTQATTTTQASVAEGVNLSAGGALSVRATGHDTLRADTEAGAGGLGTLVSSKAETRANATTTAALGSSESSGGQATAGSVAVHATQTTDFNATADSRNASVVGYSGARALNTVDTNTRASVGKGFTVNAQSFDMRAVNHVVKQALASGYNVDSASGGLLNGAAARSESLIRNRATAVVGDNALITVNVPGLLPSGALNIAAVNNVNAHDGVRLDSGGAIAVARSESEIRNELNNAQVLVGTGAQLKGDGAVNLSAHTRAVVHTVARSKTYGLAGAAQGETESLINASNRVEVSTGALVEGQGDVSLMAGTNGAQSNLLEADADTRLWNRTAVPIETDPQAHAEVNQSNDVNVAQGARVRSVRSVNLTATEGTHTTRGFGEGTDAYREVLSAIGDFFGADTSALKITGGSTWDNTRNPLALTSRVNVDGLAEAGIWHLQHLTYRADGSFSKSEGVDFTTRDNVKLADVLVLEINALRAKANELRAAAASYGGDANASATDVADALDNDARILDAQLAQLGGEARVGFLDVKPVLATTGNVNVTGRAFTGSSTGSVVAPGDVRIDIDNQSLRFMTTSTLTIPDEDGGKVLFNGREVSSAADINARNGAGSRTGISVVDAKSTPQPVIRVMNSNSNDTATGSPAQLWIQGDVSNLGGLAQAKSHGTIRASANINAETVDIATGGDFIKTYTPGFTHQGGDPIAQLGSVPGNAQNTAIAQYEGLGSDYQDRDASNSVNGDYADASLPRNCTQMVCSSTIAGNNVYISGEKLNINGLIQSGLPERMQLVDNALIASRQADIDTARARYLANPGSADRYLDLTNPEPGSTAIKVRYDAANDRLELDNVRIGGGHMELYGNIFSTGNGELRVLDGYGRINVNNTSGYDIAINRLDAGQGAEGKIRITDTAKRVINGQVDASGTRTDGKALVTEITRLGNQIQTRDSRSVDADGKPTHLADTEDGRSTTYDPVANRRFNWINGRTQTNTETRIYTKRVALGSDGLARDNDNPDTVNPGVPKLANRLTGDWLSVGGGGEGYRMDYTQVTSTKTKQGDTYQISRDAVEICIAGSCLVFSEDVKSGSDWKWTVQEYFQHSLGASKSVKVNFTGHETAQVDVNSSTGQVLLGGLVRSLNGAANVTATKGIQQLNEQAVIVARDVNLSASTGAIGSAAKPVQVNLVDTDASRGLVAGALSATARDGVAIRETDGDLRIAALQATAGALNITADRHILTTNPATILRGNDIRLASLSGDIGTFAAPLRIDTGVNGALSADAAGDIELTEVSGDLRVQQVRSRAGDVGLSVPTGSLLDANEVDRPDLIAERDLNSLWDAMSLRGDPARASADQAILNDERRVNAEYQRYWQLRNVKDLGGGNFSADAFDPGFRFQLSAAQAAALKAANNWGDADVAAYEQQQTQAFQQAHARFGSQGYSESFAYRASDAEKAAIRDGSVWTDAQLTNAIGAGLFRPVADTEVRIEDANVIGRNLRLSAQGSIGQDVDPARPGGIIVPRNLNGVTLSDEQKFALLTAEKQDLTLTPAEVRIAVKKDLDVSASGTLDAQADTGAILIGSEDDLALRRVRSNEEVRIKTGASLRNAAAAGEVAVTAKRLVLEAGQGSIGSDSATMRVDVADGGTLTARAREHIHITEATGDIRVNSVYSQRSASLDAPGAILDAGQDSVLDVQSRDINLTAGTTIGQPGGAAGALEVATALGGLLNASAPGGIYLRGAGQSTRLGNVTTAGEFSFGAIRNDLMVAGRVQARVIDLSADDNLVFESGGRLNARERVQLVAGADGQGSVVAAPVLVPVLVPVVSAPVVSVAAANAIGADGAPLRIASPDVDLQAQRMVAEVVSTDQPLVMRVGGAPAALGGVAGQPAQDVKLVLDAPLGATFSSLNTEQSSVTTNGSLTVQEGLLRDAALFFTPFYSIRIDAFNRAAQPGFDVRGFTLTGRYDLIVTPQAALIGAYVLTGNPEKVIFSNPSGVTTGQTQTGGDLNAQRDQAGSRGLALARNVQGNLAPAAGLLQISGDLFDCGGREAECEALGIAPPAAGQ